MGSSGRGWVAVAGGWVAVAGGPTLRGCEVRLRGRMDVLSVRTRRALPSEEASNTLSSFWHCPTHNNLSPSCNRQTYICRSAADMKDLARAKTSGAICLFRASRSLCCL